MNLFYFARLIAGTALLSLPRCPVYAARSTISYRYDAAGRLTDVNYGGISRTNYTYDGNGNLLSRTNALGQPELVPGNFSGLVQGMPPATGNTGFIALKISDSGRFSGKLSLGGKSYTIKGQLDANGMATVTPPGATFTLGLQVDLLGGSLQATGTISGGVTGNVLANRALFNKKTNPAPANLVGKFTALFQPTSNGPGIPQGDGYGTVNVKAAGTLRLVGRLADGTKISQGAVISGDGDWPLFVLLYRKQGFISGPVTFRALADTDFSGSVDWLKPSSLTTELDVIGSKYAAPPKGERLLNLGNTSPNAHVTLSAGNLTAPIHKPVTLTTANKVEVNAFEPERLKLSIKVPSGIIGGSFFDSGKTRKLNGVVFQKQNLGAGFFLGASESGLLELNAQ